MYRNRGSQLSLTLEQAGVFSMHKLQKNWESTFLKPVVLVSNSNPSPAVVSLFFNKRSFCRLQEDESAPDEATRQFPECFIVTIQKRKTGNASARAAWALFDCWKRHIRCCENQQV